MAIIIKKIKDLTTEEMRNICINYSGKCKYCPLNRPYPLSCWKEVIKDIKPILETEIEFEVKNNEKED